jgi:hypothetical protein
MRRVHPANKRLLQEARQSRIRCGASLHVLQLRSNSSDFARNPRDGSGSLGSRLEHRRTHTNGRCDDAKTGKRGPYKNAISN